MGRYDKYDPVDGGFRAPLAADYTGTDTAVGVSVNASGQVVLGSGNVGVSGVMIHTEDASAGDIVDVMTDGEIVEFGGAAGTAYYVDPSDGVISNDPDRTAAGTGVRIGHTVEADRLVVRAGRTVS